MDASVSQLSLLVQPSHFLSPNHLTSPHLSPYLPPTLRCPVSSNHHNFRNAEDAQSTAKMSQQSHSNSLMTRLRAGGHHCLTKCLRRGFKVRQKTQDSHRSFTLLFDLPAEIRERIYEFCCDNDRKILEEHFISAKPPPEPAIVCASRQLRKEALPVFYRHYRFPITFGSGALINKGCLPPSQEWRAARWYHRLDPAKLAMIRRLELYYCFGRFEVEFDVRKNLYVVEQTAWGSQRLVDVQPMEERMQSLALVRSLLDEVVRCPGVGYFSAADFDRLELEVSVQESHTKSTAGSGNP